MMTDRARKWRRAVTAALFVFMLGLTAWGRLSPHPPDFTSRSFWVRSSDTTQIRLMTVSSEALAQDYLRRGNAAAAARYHTAAALEDAEDIDRWLMLAQFSHERADWAAVHASLLRVLDIDPEHAEAHYKLALLLMPFDLRAAYEHLGNTLNDSRFSENGQQLRQMLAEIELLDPAYQAARIGQALAALEYWAQAEQAFTASVALMPDFAEAWAYLALVRVQQGKPVTISAAHALGHASDTGYVHFLVGAARRIEGDIDAALPLLASAQARDPANAAFALELGMAYRQAGDLPGAEYWLRYAAELAGDDGGFRRMLALFYAEEQYALAETGLAVLHEAVDELPQDADLLAAYAWALFKTGDLEGAQETLDAVFALHSDHPRGLYYQGLIYQQRGQSEAARAVFERVLGLDAPAGFDQLAIRSLEQME